MINGQPRLPGVDRDKENRVIKNKTKPGGRCLKETFLRP